MPIYNREYEHMAVDWCPNCDYPLTIVDGERIEDNGHVITSCPNCLKPLTLCDNPIVAGAGFVIIIIDQEREE